MEKNKIKCETCEFRGYNAYVCRWHKKRITDIDIKNCQSHGFYKKVGKRAVLGAGAGVVVATAGLVAAPAVGIKAAIGHALLAKLTAGSGAAGAGINVARNSRKNRSGTGRGKKKTILLPLYLKKGG